MSYHRSLKKVKLSIQWFQLLNSEVLKTTDKIRNVYFLHLIFSFQMRLSGWSAVFGVSKKYLIHLLSKNALNWSKVTVSEDFYLK